MQNNNNIKSKKYIIKQIIQLQNYGQSNINNTQLFSGYKTFQINTLFI